MIARRQVLAELASAGVLRGRRWILRNVSLTLPAHTISAVIGPNGSGKSTLAKLLTGQIWPSEGSARVHDGKRLVAAGTGRSAVRVVQPSAPLDFESALTVRQIIWTGFFGTLGLYQRPTRTMQRRTDALIASIGLQQVGDNPYGQLSTGERVRTLIARAMAIRPRLLVLDEPTTGLDLLAREQVMMTIGRVVRRSRNTAILLITHHVEELPPQTKQVMILARGKVIASGEPSAILTGQTLSRAYGVKVEVHHRHGRYYTTVHPHAWREL